jgi:hypothetical protein
MDYMLLINVKAAPCVMYELSSTQIMPLKELVRKLLAKN